MRKIRVFVSAAVTVYVSAVRVCVCVCACVCVGLSVYVGRFARGARFARARASLAHAWVICRADISPSVEKRSDLWHWCKDSPSKARTHKIYKKTKN